MEIAKRYPESYEQCITAISKQLEAFEENDYELNAFIIGDLAGMKALETLPLIERAFNADRVDEFVIDLDSFTFGNFFENLEKRGSPISPDQIQIVSSDIADTSPPLQKFQPSTYDTTGHTIKFSGKRITKKKAKKKR